MRTYFVQFISVRDESLELPKFSIAAVDAVSACEKCVEALGLNRTPLGSDDFFAVSSEWMPEVGSDPPDMAFIPIERVFPHRKRKGRPVEGDIERAFRGDGRKENLEASRPHRAKRLGQF